MGLFTKDDDIPTIPPAPTMPELSVGEYQEKRDLPELPSFPLSSKNESFNREMVKSAVSDIPSPIEEEEYVEVPKVSHKREPKKEQPVVAPVRKQYVESPIPQLPTQPSISDMPRRTLELSPLMEMRPVSKSTEPIFVRIDKFQIAQKNFEEIKNKIKEIESVLKKINDIKLQEETELKGWTEDIEKIKSRLAEVDNGIFNQI
jgi:hypothetical protein